MATSRELKELVDLAEKVGWRVSEIANGHYRVDPPTGAPVFLSRGAGINYEKEKGKLKRAGLFVAAQALNAPAKGQLVEPPRPTPKTYTPPLQPVWARPEAEPIEPDEVSTPLPPLQPPVAPAPIVNVAPAAPVAAPAPARPPTPTTTAERPVLDELTHGLVRLGKLLGRLPLDREDLLALDELLSKADGLGLTVGDVRAVLAAELESP